MQVSHPLESSPPVLSHVVYPSPLESSPLDPALLESSPPDELSALPLPGSIPPLLDPSSPVAVEPLLPVSTEPLDPVSTEPLDDPVSTEPLDPVSTEPLDDPVSTEPPPAPLSLPLLPEPLFEPSPVDPLLDPSPLPDVATGPPSVPASGCSPSGAPPSARPLSSAPPSGAPLSGAPPSGASPSGAPLSGAPLSGAPPSPPSGVSISGPTSGVEIAMGSGVTSVAPPHAVCKTSDPMMANTQTLSVVKALMSDLSVCLPPDPKCNAAATAQRLDGAGRPVPVAWVRARNPAWRGAPVAVCRRSAVSRRRTGVPIRDARML
jgi:hypothetical protein